MKDLVFIDSSAFIALNDSSSPWREKSLSWVRSIFSETVGLCTSMGVIVDTASKLKKNVSFDRAERFLKLLKKPGIQILEENEEIQEEAWELFLQSKGISEVSFYDCMKVATMHYFGITKIFTFEKYFDKLQVVRVPKG